MREIGDPSGEQATLEQIRINVAFEEMVVAVIAGALAGGAINLLFGFIELLGGFSLTLLVSVLLEGLFVIILIFLVGFGASVAFGGPLFAALEKRKRRNLWPYLGAAMGVAVAVFVIFKVGVPSAGAASIRTVAVIFVPALIVSFVFARRMTPHWRAAEKAEAEAEGSILFRIH